MGYIHKFPVTGTVQKGFGKLTTNKIVLSFSSHSRDGPLHQHTLTIVCLCPCTDVLNLAARVILWQRWNHVNPLLEPSNGPHLFQRKAKVLTASPKASELLLWTPACSSKQFRHASTCCSLCLERSSPEFSDLSPHRLWGCVESSTSWGGLPSLNLQFPTPPPLPALPSLFPALFFSIAIINFSPIT